MYAIWQLWVLDSSEWIEKVKFCNPVKCKREAGDTRIVEDLSEKMEIDESGAEAGGC